MNILLFILFLWLLIPFATAIPCNVSLSLLIKEENEKLFITPILSEKNIPFIITYWIENMQGELLKKKTITKNIRPKQYTPKTTEEVIIKAEVTPSCDDVSVEDNAIEKRYSLNSLAEQKQDNSLIQREKNSIQKKREYPFEQQSNNNASSKQNSNTQNKQTNVIFDDKKKESAEQQILIETTNNTSKEITQKKEQRTYTLLTKENTSATNTTIQEQMYTTTKQKVKNNSSYFLLSLFITLSLILVWRR